MFWHSVGAGIANGALLTIGLAIVVWLVAKIAKRPLGARKGEARAFGMWFSIYSGLAAAEGIGRLAEARAHGRVIGSLDFGGWIERHADNLLQHSPGLIGFLITGWYNIAHLLGVIGTGVALLVFGRRFRYRRYKWAILATGLPALLIFWMYPVASPAVTYNMPGGLSSIEAAAALPYAAFPSLHVCWSIVLAWSLWYLASWRPYLVAYVLLTVVAVVATGNHFIIDCLAGAALAWAVCSVVGRCITDSSAVAAQAEAGAAYGASRSRARAPHLRLRWLINR